jgi:hypothetical protein
MTLGDLAFIAMVLFTLIQLGRAVWAGIARKFIIALACLKKLGIGWAGYWVALLLVSLLSARRTLSLGEDYCSDDWCIAVVSVADTRAASGRSVSAAFRLSSAARRVSQREKFVIAYAVMRDGRRIEAKAEPDQPPFDVMLGPQQSIMTLRLFLGVAAADVAAIEITREGGCNFPRCCIIGEDDSLLHKRTWVDPGRIPVR